MLEGVLGCLEGAVRVLEVLGGCKRVWEDVGRSWRVLEGC